VSLWKLHRVFIVSAMALCVVYAGFEALHAREHAPSRVALGIGLPLAALALLGWYYARVARRGGRS
jgi:hypothetical protein